MRALAIFATCVGCSFSHGKALDVIVDGDGADIGSSDGGDGPAAPAPLHLGSADGDAGTDPLTLSGTVVIDTSGTPSITGATLPARDLFDVRPQLGGGPDLAVLHVGTLVIAPGAQVSVGGSRPFVIVAGGTVDIAGVLDGSASGARPGAGGAMPGMGTNPGLVGNHGASSSDSGGGGGGNGQAGAPGGDVTCAPPVDPGAGGAAIADPAIATLDGGSGGGASSGPLCIAEPAGAGGGALQISSAISITIDATGRVLAGGGGGGGGVDCGTGDANAGAGGGAGGAIVLQAPSVANAGIVAANGGGGGGGGDGGVGSGTAGQDSQPSASAAMGGPGQSGATGGNGGAAIAPVAGLTVVCGVNAGGGGGGAGRIAASAGYADTGTTMPSASTSLPP